MSDCNSIDTADWRQYHPTLQQKWDHQITAYHPPHIKYKNEVYQPQFEPKEINEVYKPLQINDSLSQQSQVLKEGFANWKPQSQLKPWK